MKSFLDPQDAQPLHVLVTGAAGFLGSHLSRHLVGEGHIVYGLDLVRGELNPSNRLIWIDCDLSAPLLPSALPQNLDVVVHLAFMDATFPDKANEACAVNVMGTQRLLSYACQAGIRHFVLASSGAIYGFGPRPFREDDDPRPFNHYAVTKYCSELLLRPYQEFYNTTVLRLFFPYGTGQRGRLLPRLVQSVQDQQEVVIYGEGKPRINPIHVSDVLAVIDKVIPLAGHHVLNVAGREAFTVREITELIGTLLQKNPVYRFVRDPLRHDLIGDISAMETLLAFGPEVCLAEGLRDLL